MPTKKTYAQQYVRRVGSSLGTYDSSETISEIENVWLPSGEYKAVYGLRYWTPIPYSQKAENSTGMQECGRWTYIVATDDNLTNTYAAHGYSSNIDAVAMFRIGEHVTATRNDVIVAPTCLQGGNHDLVSYCAICGEEFTRTNIVDEKLGHNYVDGYCTRCGDEDPKLPEAGKTLAQMTLKEIQSVARFNKTSDYNIKIGDRITIKDNITKSNVTFEVVGIGEDYIEFMSTTAPINYNATGYSSTSTKTTLLNGSTVTAYSTNFYTKPRVFEKGSFGSTTSESIIGYHNSDIRNLENNWVARQTEELQNVIKETERTYNKATLTYTGTSNSPKFTAVITGTETVTDKAYMPTTEEFNSIKASSSTWNNIGCSTATVYPFTNETSTTYVFGSYGYVYKGNVSGYSNGHTYALVMFRIG